MSCNARISSPWGTTLEAKVIFFQPRNVFIWCKLRSQRHGSMIAKFWIREIYSDPACVGTLPSKNVTIFPPWHPPRNHRGCNVGSMGSSCNYWRKLDSFDELGEILEWLRKVNTFLVWIAMKILVHIVIHLPHYWSATPAAFAWWSSDYAREKTSIARGPGNKRKMMFWRIAWDISVSSVTHEMKARRTGDSFLEILELCQSIVLLSAFCSDIDARDLWMNKKSKPWPWEFVG